MIPRVSIRSVLAIGCVAAALVAGCKDQSPHAMVQSAKDYLAKQDTRAAIVQLKTALQKNEDDSEARFLLGKALLDTEEVLAAEKELTKAAELGYPRDQIDPLLVEVLVTKGEYKRVIAEYGASVDKNGGSAAIKAAVGDAALATKDLALAERGFSQAVATDPNYGPAYLGLALLQTNRGDVAKATELTDKATTLPPKRELAWKFRGDLYLVQGKTEDAIKAYRSAIDAKHAYLPAYSAVISTLVHEKRLDEAAKELEDMKKVGARRPPTLYSEALVALYRNDLNTARDAIQEDLKLTPNDASAVLLSAAINYQLKAYAEAESQLVQIVRAAPNADMPRELLVETYMRTGQAQRALETLQPMLPRIDKQPKLLNVAAEVYLQNGDAVKAAEYFQKASALDDKDPNARTGLALTHLAQGDRQSAMRELEAAASVDSGVRPDLALITTALQRREYDRALTALDALEKKQPNTALAQNLRGLALLGKKDTENARKSFERALTIDPNFFAATLNLARLEVAEGKNNDAAKRLENYVAKNPKNATALVTLAELRTRQKAPPDQITDLLTRAVAAAPSDIPARVSLISHYLAIDDGKRALTAAQDARAAIPGSPEILQMLAKVQRTTGDLNQALVTLQALAELRPKSPVPLVEVAEVQVLSKDYDAALRSLRKALEVQPGFLPAEQGLVIAYLRQNKVPQAVAVARDVQKQHPNDAVGYVLEGDVHASVKETKEAIASYRAALKLNGGAVVSQKLHSMLVASGQAGEADRMATAWVKEHPEDATFQAYLGELAQRRGDNAAAVRFYETALAAQPNNPVLLNNFAYAAGQINDPRALDSAEKANTLAPNQPAILDTLGTLLVQKGDATRGVELLRKATELAPDTPALRLNLARALIKAGQKDSARQELTRLSRLGNRFPAQDEVEQLMKAL